MEILALLWEALVDHATKRKDPVVGRPKVWQQACRLVTGTAKANESLFWRRNSRLSLNLVLKLKNKIRDGLLMLDGY